MFCSWIFRALFCGCILQYVIYVIFCRFFPIAGAWQQLSSLSLLSCFLSFGVSTSGSLSSPALMKLYFPCLFMLILYGLQFIPISLVLCCFLITSLGTLSPINLGVVFRFVFFSVPYLSFCLRLWNFAFEIIDPVLFFFDFLCLQFFCCFRLRNFACEILGLVLFLFHLLCAISWCCFRLRNLAC